MAVTNQADLVPDNRVFGSLLWLEVSILFDNGTPKKYVDNALRATLPNKPPQEYRNKCDTRGDQHWKVALQETLIHVDSGHIHHRQYQHEFLLLPTGFAPEFPL